MDQLVLVVLLVLLVLYQTILVFQAIHCDQRNLVAQVRPWDPLHQLGLELLEYFDHFRSVLGVLLAQRDPKDLEDREVQEGQLDTSDSIRSSSFRSWFQPYFLTCQAALVHPADRQLLVDQAALVHQGDKFLEVQGAVEVLVAGVDRHSLNFIQ